MQASHRPQNAPVNDSNSNMEVTYHMKDLLDQMNAILTDWSTLFDIMQELPLRLTVNDRGEPLLNETRLPWLSGLVLESTHFDPESICYFFSDGYFLKIIIHWPEEEPPVIGAVFLGYGNADEAAV